LTDALTFMLPSPDLFDDPAARQIARRQFQPDTIADQHPDEILPGSARRMRRHLPLMLDADAVKAVRQRLEYYAFDRNAHSTPVSHVARDKQHVARSTSARRT
jgi:hypothetical protein